MNNKLYLNEQLFLDLLYAHNQQTFSFVHDTFCPVLHGSLIDLIETDKERTSAMLDNAFITVGQSLHSYDDRQQKLFAWLLHMMHQLAVVALRQLNKWPPAEQLEYLSIGLSRTLSTMNIRQRRVIQLIYDEGYTKAQVAQALNISVETVDALLQTGLMQMRMYLKTFF